MEKKKTTAAERKQINLGGRPETWSDPVKLKEAVNKYFNDCDNTIIIKQFAHSKGVTKVKIPKPYTMAGLALALGISRELLNQYKGDTRFVDIVMDARKIIEEQNLTLAMLGCHDSKIAALNLASNYGYATKKELDITDNTAIQAIMDSLPEETRKQVAEAVKEKLKKVNK